MTTALAAHILEDLAALEALVAPLDEAAVGELVDHLKSEADRHWFINANHSLEFAELIIHIGRLRGNLRHTALGTMARGDALKYLGNLQEAWDELERAGAMFMDAGDGLGWARTRIGKLVLCVNLQCVDEALVDAQQAQVIFLEKGDHEKLFRLEINQGLVLHVLGKHQEALSIYFKALSRIENVSYEKSTLDGIVQTNIALLYTNIGNVYNSLGDYKCSLLFHQKSFFAFQSLEEISGAAHAEFNIAHVYLAQGYYRRALSLLHRSRLLYSKLNLNLDVIDVNRDIIECYVIIGRHSDAVYLAQQTIADYMQINADFDRAITLLHLSSAEAGLGNYTASQQALCIADEVFLSLKSERWLAVVRLRQGYIALKQGELQQAIQYSIMAERVFKERGEQVNLSSAALLYSQVQLAWGDFDSATAAGISVLHTAQTSNVPILRYNAHLLLGRVAERQSDLVRAQRHYSAAVATVERVQRGLTLTLRPSFLEDKGEALRALIGLDLQQGRLGKAFEALERGKSQTLLGYLANQDSLHWPADDPQAQALVNELNQLREEHHWFYRLAHEQQRCDDEPRSAVLPAQARAEVVAREKRMRAITEQLYLHGDGLGQIKLPRLGDVQAALDPGVLLIEFYNDGEVLWAFTLEHSHLQAQRLSATPADVDQLIEQLQCNISFALDAGQEAATIRALTTVTQRILQKLYTALLAPVEAQCSGQRRLIVVPYGALHYLPFHLLHSRGEYLIERHEVVVLPAASMLTRPGPTRPAGARVFAHSWEGRLPLTRSEAHTVQQFFDSSVYLEEQARRDALGGAPRQILHIAAHGQHRLDQPDLSFIQLADGQLYTDDLLQHDLSYELVVLSACETGRANVTAGDELIGLGRGFLYAGAGALIASLWRVVDATTLRLMAKLYQQLRAGVSKAAALRVAQLALLAEHPGMHPAFWGAFQLVGDARPLTGFTADTHIDADLRAPMSVDLQHHFAEYA